MRKHQLLLLTLTAATIGVIAVSAGRTWQESRVWTGLSLAERSGAVVVDMVIPEGPADDAGLVEGDTVVTVAGYPVSSVLAAQNQLARTEPGRAVGLRVMRSGNLEALQIETAAMVSWRWDRVVSVAVALLFCLGALTATFRPRPGSSRLVYAIWCVAGALVLGVSWSSHGQPVDWVLYWVDRVARLAFPALWIHLALSIRASVPQQRWLPVAYAPSAALMFAELHMVGLSSALRASDPVAAVDLLQSRVEYGWIGLALLIGLGVLARSVATKRPRVRARASWLLAGAAIGVLPFVAVSVIPQVVGGSEPTWSWLSLLSLGCVPLIFTSAVVDYRLMDLALFARRGLTFGTTLAFSILLFLGLFSLAKSLLPAFMQPPGFAPMLAAALITALLTPAIRAGARDLVGRLYYRRRYSFRRALERVARELNSEQELTEVTRVLEKRISEALDAKPVWLLLKEKGKRLIDPVTRRPVPAALSDSLVATLCSGRPAFLADVGSAPSSMPLLHRNNVQVLVPLQVKGELIGVLAVGPRRTGSLLDSDDLDLLRTAAAHASSAVAGAQNLDRLREQVQLVQQLQARAETLIESSPIGMLVVDSEGKVRHWNSAVESLLGVGKDQALEQHYHDVLPSPLHPFLARALEAGIAADGLRAYRVRVAAGEDSDPLLVNAAANPLRSIDPQLEPGVLISLDNVTDQVRLEQQLIQQDRLASVGMLAAGVAHEVNTPLTGISSYAQMLLTDAPSEDPRRPILEKVVAQAQRASKIARGLLNISRPARGAQKAVGPVRVSDLVEETIGLLGPQRREGNIDLVNATKAQEIVVEGDQSGLQQVLMNLLLNAFDAARPDGHVEVRSRVDENGCAVLEVCDDGDGIDEDVRARMFDPFFTTKQPGKGTGLGLSISFAIAREHGGTLEALPASYGPDGQCGTVMRLTLPSVLSPVVERRAG